MPVSPVRVPPLKREFEKAPAGDTGQLVRLVNEMGYIMRKLITSNALSLGASPAPIPEILRDPQEIVQEFFRTQQAAFRILNRQVDLPSLKEVVALPPYGELSEPAYYNATARLHHAFGYKWTL